jgi:hypothetical protein
MSKEIAGPAPTITFSHTIPLLAVLDFCIAADDARGFANHLRQLVNRHPGHQRCSAWNAMADAADIRRDRYLKAAEVVAPER